MKSSIPKKKKTKTNGVRKGIPVAHNTPHISGAGTVISEGLLLNQLLYFLKHFLIRFLTSDAPSVEDLENLQQKE